MFGCSEQNTHYKGSRKVGTGAFDKLQPCSDAEVERYVYKCEVLSKRYVIILTHGGNRNIVMRTMIAHTSLQICFIIFHPLVFHVSLCAHMCIIRDTDVLAN